MTFLSLISRQRRALALVAASGLLHYLTIDWVGAHIGPAQRSPAKARPAIIVAQLHQDSAPVPATPAAPLARVLKAAPPAPRRAPEPDLPAEAAPAPAPVPAETAAPAPAEAAPGGPVKQAGAAAVMDENKAVPESAPAPERAVVAAEPPLSPGARRYKVNLPPSTELSLEVARTDADGARWNGVAAMSWRTDGSRYKMMVEAGISVIITRVNLLVMTSEGIIDDAGIAPVLATQKKKGRARTDIHFNRDAGMITFSASERSLPLPAGAQDQATLPFQLAGIGRADVNQFASDLEITVGDDKDATVSRFTVVGQEELETALGKLMTWHLARPPRQGAYNSRLDVWLAPARDWLPVQIRNTEASGAVTTQSVSKIVTLEAGIP
ncbi:MAG: DUF3108 domain-containing protein [Pseudomonadota bacterium]